MSTNKSISYLLCNKSIIVNLYKLHFLSFHFSFQPNKRVFYPPTFPSLQPNTHERKLNIFYPPTNFPSSHFSTPPTKWTLNQNTNSNQNFKTNQIRTKKKRAKLIHLSLSGKRTCSGVS